MSKPSEEVLFYARCQLEGMLVVNLERQRHNEAPAYPEEAFMRLAEETRGDFRTAQGFDTNP